MAAGTEGERRESVNSRIADHVVTVTREYTGRGPTRARTFINDDLVTVVLVDILTKGEQSLVRNGRIAEVMHMRQAFQDTMKTELVSGVERILGRRVIAFMSATHVEPDLAIESFVLAPEG